MGMGVYDQQGTLRETTYLFSERIWNQGHGVWLSGISMFKKSKYRGTKCLKYQPCDVIKMREMIEEVGKKTLKKDIDNPSFL